MCYDNIESGPKTNAESMGISEDKEVVAMSKATDFRLLSVQAALFFLDGKSFSTSSFLANMLGKFVERYDGSVQAIPFRDEAPPELPRIILQSKDAQWKLQSTLNRIDSFWNANDLLHENNDVISQCAKVLHYFVETTPSLTITRLGLVIVRLSPSEQPAQELIDRFCIEEAKNNPFRHSENFEIHNHKKYKLKQTGYLVNSWVRCKSGLVREPQATSAITVAQDINTPEDIENIFGLENVMEFFQECQHEMSEILSIYFPEER